MGTMLGGARDLRSAGGVLPGALAQPPSPTNKTSNELPRRLRERSGGGYREHFPVLNRESFSGRAGKTGASGESNAEWLDGQNSRRSSFQAQIGKQVWSNGGNCCSNRGNSNGSSHSLSTYYEPGTTVRALPESIYLKLYDFGSKGPQSYITMSSRPKDSEFQFGIFHSLEK